MGFRLELCVCQCVIWLCSHFRQQQVIFLFLVYVCFPLPTVDKGTYRMLNAAINFGLYVQGGVLKGEEYSEEAPGWTDLSAMDKYEMNVVHQASSSLHRLQFRNVDVEGAPLVNVKIRAETHSPDPDDIRYKVDMCQGDEEGADFQLRLASNMDEFGTYPLYITAFHNGHSLVLHQNIDNDI
eukprot:Selendium_serpulae@DN6496_c1_g1_i29.p1